MILAEIVRSVFKSHLMCSLRLTEYDLARVIKHCHGSDRWRHGCRRRAYRDTSC